MKICMVSRFYPPKVGGSGSFLEILSESLARKGFEITVITQKMKGRPKESEKSGVKIKRAFTLEGSLEFSNANMAIGSVAFAKKILENRDNDVFHSHDLSTGAFSLCLAKKILAEKPCVMKYGGDMVYEYLSIKNFPDWDCRKGLDGTLAHRKGVAGILHKVEDWYFKSADFIAADADGGKKFLVKRGVHEGKVSVLPNGVDMKKFAPMPKEKARVQTGMHGKAVLFSARLVKWKGCDVLLNAMRRVCASDEKANLVIAGKGAEEENLKALAKSLGIENKVEFRGSIEREKMPLYCNSCDAFVLPSFFDTTPNSLVEAMACKKPCIASKIDGMAEVIQGGAGLSFKPGNENDLAEKILEVLQNAGKAKILGSKALERVKEKYSQEKAVERYEKFYERITAHR
ncbi:MAG: glycosyltransferase family 4 protein [Candidatus Diapherotrites archaeon]|nr:glycosyltransferase family 4 protein [Candidatus Diapherotrites archaeon]